MMYLVVDRLPEFNAERLRPIFGERITDLIAGIIDRRREQLRGGLDALRRQYPDYLAALELRFLRQSAVRQEVARYQSLFDDGLIPQELFDDLRRDVTVAHAAEPRPRFDIGLDTRRLIERLDLLAALDPAQLDLVAKLLRPRFTVPNERIIRAGARGDAVYFIASGAVEVRLPARRVRLGSGEFFGEMALVTGQLRQADVLALSYCRLLVLRKADFDRFIAANPDAGAVIERVARERLAMNRDDSGGGDDIGRARRELVTTASGTHPGETPAAIDARGSLQKTVNRDQTQRSAMPQVRHSETLAVRIDWKQARFSRRLNGSAPSLEPIAKPGRNWRCGFIRLY